MLPLPVFKSPRHCAVEVRFISSEYHTRLVIMANRRMEEHLEQLGLLRGATPAEALPPLRKALNDKANLIVAKAAKIAGELMIRELLPDLLAAYGRLFDDPVKRDTQCWGKNAIAKALHDMDY